MNNIKIITDEDLNLKKVPFHNPRHRYGARGIILNENDEIAIMYKEKKKEYKLIGGGVENNESPEEAFIREALEETGYLVNIIEFMGTTEELKTHDNFIQTSYIFIAKIKKNTHKKHLTEQEEKEGAKILWCNLNAALQLIEESTNHLLPSPYESDLSLYHTKFIVKRDYEILKYYKENYIELQK